MKEIRFDSKAKTIDTSLVHIREVLSQPKVQRDFSRYGTKRIRNTKKAKRIFTDAKGPFTEMIKKGNKTTVKE